jgi:plasmid stabilization system protein ParE
MKFRFLPEAKQEYKEAARFYRQIDSTLAREFIAPVEESVAAICRNPLACLVATLNIRRCLIAQFPYGLFYSHDAENVTIYAVMHLHREPGYWIERRP